MGEVEPRSGDGAEALWQAGKEIGVKALGGVLRDLFEGGLSGSHSQQEWWSAGSQGHFKIDEHYFSKHASSHAMAELICLWM